MFSLFIICQLWKRLCLPLLTANVKISLLMRWFIFQFALFPKWQRHVFYFQFIFVFLWRVQRWMWIIRIQAYQPGSVIASVLFNKFNCFFHTPGCLMIFSRNSYCLPGEIWIWSWRPCCHACIFTTINICPFQAFLLQPVLVTIFPMQPVIIWMLTPLHICISIVCSVFHPALCGCEMQFS